MGGEINSRLRRHAVTYFGCRAARTVQARHDQPDPPELDEGISNAVGTQKQQHPMLQTVDVLCARFGGATHDAATDMEA